MSTFVAKHTHACQKKEDVKADLQ